jgi:hypothetical protein
MDKQTPAERVTILIEDDAKTRCTIRNIQEYPYGTLSNEFRNQKAIPEARVRRALQVTHLDKEERIPTPSRILHHWFTSHFTSAVDFFCFENPNRALTDLRDHLSESPFYCIYVACITMNSEKRKQTPQPKSTHASRKRKRKPSINETDPAQNKVFPDKLQSVISVSGNPVEWIFHKNRRVLTQILQSLILRKEENDRSKGIITTPPERKTSENAGRLNKELLDQIFKGDTENPERVSEIPNSILSRKLKSSWVLVGYIMMDRTENPECINNIVSEILKSKGISNRIATLCKIAGREGKPFWIAEEALTKMNVNSPLELIV